MMVQSGANRRTILSKKSSIELVVMIEIIAILAAILLPVFAQDG